MYHLSGGGGHYTAKRRAGGVSANSVLNPGPHGERRSGKNGRVASDRGRQRRVHGDESIRMPGQSQIDSAN